MGTLYYSKILRKQHKLRFSFFNIVSPWHVSPKDQIILLDKPPESTFYNLKKGQNSNLSADTLKKFYTFWGCIKPLVFFFINRTS